VQSKRFNYETPQMENPGPGRYKTKHRTIEKISTSYSKRGTGSFASKSSRAMPNRIPKAPDAATYNLPSLLRTQCDFSANRTTSSFQKPTTLVDKNYELNKKSLMAPAPNTYFRQDEKKRKFLIGRQQVFLKNSEPNAFLSTAKRDTLEKKALRNPSPCHYNIQEKLTKREPPALSSVFSSGTQRGFINTGDVPGPGTYKPNEPIVPPFKLTMPRKHYLAISAPALEMPTALEQPGPGAYEVVDYDGPEKRFMSSGVFVSNTSRWNNSGGKTKNQPGPTTYKPTSVGKQSFMFNVYNRWVPA